MLNTLPACQCAHKARLHTAALAAQQAAQSFSVKNSRVMGSAGFRGYPTCVKSSGAQQRPCSACLGVSQPQLQRATWCITRTTYTPSGQTGRQKGSWAVRRVEK
jgi:hypothetical protein